MGTFRRGDRVSAKTYGGERVTRIVWQDLGSTVVLCSERQYEALERGSDEVMPIGFPRADVAPVDHEEAY